MLNNPYQNRKYVVSAIIVGVVLVYIVRLFSLQGGRRATPCCTARSMPRAG